MTQSAKRTSFMVKIQPRKAGGRVAPDVKAGRAIERTRRFNDKVAESIEQGALQGKA